jgi:hypothetical protein
MARTDAGAALTEQHRQGQLQLRAAAIRDFALIWPLWQGDEQSFGRLVDATVPLVGAHYQASATFAAAYFDAFRRAERVTGGRVVARRGTLNVERVVASLHVTGRVMTRRALAAGHSPQQAMQTALVRTTGAVSRHMLAGGRDTVILSAAEDRSARGWERVLSGDPCEFCLMLAGRGAVYSADTADFRAHDHCACAAAPAY